jgi:2-dehydropantoate 2-reductase
VRICILGAGGLGSVLGGWLAESGVDVTLVGRPAHMDAIRSHGLRITGIRGDRTVSAGIEAVDSPDAADGDFDYVVLLVKAKDTETALAKGESLRERCGTVLSLQNAVGKEDRLRSWVGTDRVIGASTTEAGTLVGPGHVRHTATAPTTAYFGELDGRPSVRVAALVDAFSSAGFASAETGQIAHVEWEKFLQIAIVGAWSVSTMGGLGGSMAQALAVRPAAEHYVQIATELLAVYRAMGYAPQDFFAPYSRFRRLSELSFPEAVDDLMTLGAQMRAAGVIGRPSLHDDLLRGRTTEVDVILAPFLDEADRHACPVPTARAAYRVIKVLEQWLVGIGGVEPRSMSSFAPVEAR